MIHLEKALSILDISPTSRSGITELIYDIFILKKRLKHPNDQSEYFRWGYDSSKERLLKLIDQYNLLKDEFNTLTLDDMIYSLNAENEKLDVVMNSKYPIFIKIVLRNLAEHRINVLEGFLRIRSTIDQLPEVSELEVNQDMLTHVFEASE